LPVYPAIAVLAGRALNALIAGSPQGADTRAPSARRFLSARAVSAFVVFADLTLLLLNRNLLKRSTTEKARFAFINRVSEIVPARAALFATPDFEGTELLVIAYRLQREIKRKSIVCGARDEYFLAPFDFPETPAETRTLASSKMDDVSLVALRFAPNVPPQECLRESS